MSSLSYVDEMPTQMAYEKPCVYFTTSNLVTLDDAHLDNADFSLRVTTLPRDYSDEEGATKLFEEVLRIGKVSKMVIVEKSFYNRRLSTNTTTHSATVDFEYWNNNTANVQLRDYIVNNHNAKISIVANDQLYWENGEPMSHLSISKGNSSPHSLLGVSKQNDENNQLSASNSNEDRF